MNLKILILIASMISWGISNPLADLAITKFSPLFLALIECGVGFIFLLLVTAIRRIRPQIPWRVVVFIGIMQPGLGWLLGNTGYTKETASTGVLILTGETLFTVFIGVFWLGDRLSYKQWFYILLGMSGVVVASATGAHLDTSSTSIYFVLSAALFGLYANILRKYLSEYSSVELVLGQTFISVVFLTVLYTFSGQSPPTNVSTHIWVSAILSGVFGVGLPFVAFNYALQNLPARITGPSLNIIPIVGIAGSIALGRGAPTLAQLFGGVIVIASIALIAQKDKDSV
jgi:drug/metabolite transporter (DMT)-like permease